MFKWLLSPISIILGAASVLTSAAAAYFFVYHLGFSAAQKQCDAEAIRSQLNAEIIKEHNLQEQLDATNQIQPFINTNKKHFQQQENNATNVINSTIKDNASCDVPVDIIRMLNSQRSTASGSN